MADAIDLSLSAGSIDRAISELNAWQKEVRKKADRICRRTGNYARNQATNYYSSYVGPPPKHGFGAPSVSLVPYSDDHGVHVVASGDPMYPEGNTISFYEFGSGTAAGVDNPIAARVGARPKSWSSTYGTHEFADTGEWHYKENEDSEPMTFTAIPGTNAMYRASQDAKVRMQELIKKEFG